MTLRQRLFIVIGIIVAIILIVLLLFFAFNRRKTQAPGTTTTPAPVTDVVPSGGQPSVPTASPPAPAGNPEDIYLKQLSRIFIERYGSFSNQNDNQHIADILPLSTARMQQYLQSKEQTFGTVYHGMTTHVVASRILDKTAQSADVHVDVQRIVSDGLGEKTEYDSAKIVLAKEGNAWKVDGVYWGQ